MPSVASLGSNLGRDWARLMMETIRISKTIQVMDIDVSNNHCLKDGQC